MIVGIILERRWTKGALLAELERGLSAASIPSGVLVAQSLHAVSALERATGAKPVRMGRVLNSSEFEYAASR